MPHPSGHIHGAAIGRVAPFDSGWPGTAAEWSSMDRFRVAAAIMNIERASGSAASYLDIVDRVLDKGIVIDAHMGVSVGGIDLMTIEVHLIVASIATYLADRPDCDGAGGTAKRSWNLRS